MNVFRRSLLYLYRKKGQLLILFLLFAVVSTLLISCFSILDASSAVAKELRTSVGGAFYLRPTSNLALKDGKLAKAKGPPPVISDENIEEIMSGGNIKYCNSINYGYARSPAIDFIPGAGHNDGSNMGKVTAVNYTALAELFLENKLELTKGRHITKGDKNKILISEQLAAANHLKVGDRVRFTHADLERKNGVFRDAIPQKNAFCSVEIAGLYREVEAQTAAADSPTPGRSENQIYADHNFLLKLKEQEAGKYTGEVNFYVSDPLRLDEIIDKTEKMKSIDWSQFSLRENDFEYSKIAGSLSSIQHLARILIICTSIVSIVVLVLILTMRLRGRVHEAGILLAIGKTKKGIIMQFLMEVLMIFSLAYVCAVVISYAVAPGIEELILGGLPKTNIDVNAIETGLASEPGAKSYMQIKGNVLFLLFFCQAAVMTAAVVTSCGSIVSLRPKEILSKMR